MQPTLSGHARSAACCKTIAALTPGSLLASQIPSKLAQVQSLFDTECATQQGADVAAGKQTALARKLYLGRDALSTGEELSLANLMKETRAAPGGIGDKAKGWPCAANGLPISEFADRPNLQSNRSRMDSQTQSALIRTANHKCCASTPRKQQPLDADRCKIENHKGNSARLCEHTVSFLAANRCSGSLRTNLDSGGLCRNCHIRPNSRTHQPRCHIEFVGRVNLGTYAQVQDVHQVGLGIFQAHLQEFSASETADRW